jgi:hypothetical protein
MDIISCIRIAVDSKYHSPSYHFLGNIHTIIYLNNYSSYEISGFHGSDYEGVMGCYAVCIL